MILLSELIFFLPEEIPLIIPSLEVGGLALAAQWLKLCVSTAGVTGSVLGQGLRSCMLQSVAKKGGNPLLGSTGYKLVVYSPLQIFCLHFGRQYP